MAWITVPGTGDLTVDGVFKTASHNNVEIGETTGPASGQNVLVFANAATAPVSLAGLVGGILFVQSGHLQYMGQHGTLTVVASA